MTFRPDPKPQRKPRKRIRVIDKSAARRKLSADGRCRCGCGRDATDGHHIVQKGSPHFGDDVEDNILPTNHECHMRWHDGRPVQFTLRQPEIDYVLSKLGPDPGRIYIKRFYNLEVL